MSQSFFRHHFFSSNVILIRALQSCLIRFKAAQSICIETFKDFPQLGRFMLRDEGKTIAVGIITALHFPKAGGAVGDDGTSAGGAAAGGGDH